MKKNKTIKLGKNIIIKENVELNYVTVGNNVKIGKNVTIFGSSRQQVIIGDNTYISANCYFNGAFGLKIGNNVTFSYGVVIYTDSGPNVGTLSKKYRTEKKQIVIKDNCWVGAYSILLPGSHMEKESVLGANSFLKTRIKNHEVFGGNPAKLIKKLDIIKTK